MNKKLGLKKPAKVGDELLCLSIGLREAFGKTLPHRFVVKEIRHAGTVAEALVDADGLVYSPVTCGTVEQYDENCLSIATLVSGDHSSWHCPKCLMSSRRSGYAG